MIKTVDKVNFTDIKGNFRFDVRYYYLGNILNKILSNFKTKPLTEFSKFIKKGIFDLNSRFYRTEGVPFIRISDLMAYTLNEKGMVYIPTENHLKEIKTKLVPGDLALSKIGKYLGKISQIPLRYDEVNISQNIIGVSFKCEDYLRKYVFLYLTTPLAINQILRVSKQHNQNKLTLPDIRNLKIPLLSEDRMKYFATEVDLLSELDDSSFKAIKHAQELFYKNLDIDFNSINKEFCFTTNLKSIKEESFFSPEYSNPLYVNSLKQLSKYKTKSLSELFNSFKGSEVGSENYNLYTDKTETDVPFIRTSDIVNFEVDNYPDFFIADDIFQEINQKIQKNDIIFSKDGSIGHIAMITEADKVIVASGFSILRLKKEIKISPYYIFCALSIPEISGYQSKMRTVIASTIPHLRPSNLLKIKIPLLEEKIQNEISDLIELAFNKKAERKLRLDKIKKELELEFEKNRLLL